jgi:hypothetical protein
MQALSDVFTDEIISSFISPGHIPEICPCDFFFFWDCLKDKVYNSYPQTEGLKEIFRKDIANISAEQLERVNQNHFRRCEEFLHVDGQHFQRLLLSVNCNYFIPNIIGQQEY